MNPQLRARSSGVANLAIVGPMNRVSLIVIAAYSLPMVIAAQPPAASPKEYARYAARPEYPLEARRHHMEGRGIFAMHIRPNGTVASVEIVKSTGYAVLDGAAISALRQWRFHPKPFKRVVTTPMSFTIGGLRTR
jgi:TonB family protein